MSKLLNAALFLFFVVLIAISFYGIDAPEDRISEKRVKQFTIQTYRYGLTISNDNKIFYNITPLNFYFEVFGNKRSAVELNEDIAIEESKTDSKLAKLMQSLMNSLKLNKLVATIKTNDQYFVLNGNLQGNTLTVTPTLNNTTPTSLAQALTYNKGDLVFDENMEVYTPIDDILLGEINSYYGTVFKNETESPDVTGKSVLITNLENPGVIQLDLKNKTAQVDNQKLAIEIRTSENQDLKLNFYNNLAESLEALR